MKTTIEIKGLRELQHLLRPVTRLYAEPWRDGMDHLAQKTHAAATRTPPRKTGKLAGSIKTNISKASFPSWLRIRVSAKAKRYPYPRLLEFSPKHHHQGWLRTNVDPIWRNAGAILTAIGIAIANKWRAGI